MTRALALAGLVVAAVGGLACATASAQDAPAGRTPSDPAFVVGPPTGTPVAGAALDDRTEDVASLLRCPVCQGLSVADSPASMAVNMKAEVKDLLAKGYADEQILAYFEHSYGEFVRLKPPLRGVNWLVWLGPLAALLAGGLVVALALRKPRDAEAGAPAAAGIPGRDALPDDARLAAAVLKVRERAYGWPAGKAPGEPPA
jgi:cytochrome c-type biogenesis protein CcmH